MAYKNLESLMKLPDKIFEKYKELFLSDFPN